MSSSIARTARADQRVGQRPHREILAGGPHELAVGPDPEPGAGHVGLLVQGVAPADLDAGVDGRRDAPVVDQQRQVLAHGGHGAARGGHGPVPGADVGAPVRVDHDGRRAPMQTPADAAALHESAGAVGRAEGAVERHDRRPALARPDHVAVAPAGAAGVLVARMEHETDQALVEAHQRDREARLGVRRHARDPDPGRAPDGGQRRPGLEALVMHSRQDQDQRGGGNGPRRRRRGRGPRRGPLHGRCRGRGRMR